MITVINPNEREFYAVELEQMHRLRHRVFKERMQWNVRSEDGLEVDKYDKLDATYLLAGDNAVQGTWRILPTTGPYMLRDVFPELLDDHPPPSSPTVWETSRFAVDCGLSGRAGLAAVSHLTGMLFCGLVEYALSQGITDVWTAYDIRVGRLLNRVGCQPAWEGRRHKCGKTVSVAGRFEISKRVLSELRRANAITGSVLRSREKASQKHAA